MIFERVKEIVIDQIGVPENKLTLDTSLVGDLGADSLDAVEILMTLEDEFNVEIPDEVAEKFLTLRDMVEYLEKSV